MKSMRVNLSLPEEMVKAIDEQADKDERTRSNYILWVLKKTPGELIVWRPGAYP